MIRLLIVDDAIFVRKALTRLLAQDPEIEVVGEAASGNEALEQIGRLEPDLVTLDLDMPGIDGLTTLRHMKRLRPELQVIILSALAHEGAPSTLDALQSGAVDFVDKSALNLMDFGKLSAELLAKIRLWDPARRGPERRRLRTTPGWKRPRVHWAEYRLCVIGASTGGPHAIEALLRCLPAGFPLPLLVVQHMPVGFTRAFAARLAAICPLEVIEGSQGESLRRGRVVIARAGFHSRVDEGLHLRLTAEPATSTHRPSVDVAMGSACAATAGRLVGVLLSGMGEDGAEGLQAIHRAGGLTLAESEESCVVAGMPRAAFLRGAVTYYLGLGEIVDLMAAGHESPASPARDASG